MLCLGNLSKAHRLNIIKKSAMSSLEKLSFHLIVRNAQEVNIFASKQQFLNHSQTVQV
jgi:hypothetical protein